MRPLPRGVWQYATLLIFLFAIASVAAWTTMSYLYENIRAEEYIRILNVVSFKVWALTMGFMLIAGAFGLWAIQFSAETESQRRIGELVETMDYLDDGLLSMDRRGNITGVNPSLKRLLPEVEWGGRSIREAFPCLSEADINLLLNMHGPNEVQRDLIGPGGKRALRFRSQTAGGTSLALISDVTTMRQEESRRQHIARLELIGRIARGVTNDFNNILTGISGYAALLGRLMPGNNDVKSAVSAIVKESERGAMLAGHLLEFGRLSVVGKPTEELGEHVQKASELLRLGLAPEWRVETNVGQEFPLVSVSGLQIEQVVLNLCLVAADVMSAPGEIRITAERPSPKDHLLNVGENFAAVVVISVSANSAPPGSAGSKGFPEHKDVAEAGVIHSVVRSLIEEAGGKVDFFAGGGGGRIYRIALPYGSVETTVGDTGEIAEEILSYVAHWRVLVARSRRSHDCLEEKLRDLGASVERADGIASVLARVEDAASSFHAIVIEKDILGDEAGALLRAIVKLCPGSGIVVLCEDPELEPHDLRSEAVFQSRRSEPSRVVTAMVEARAIAVRRRTR